MKVLFTLTILLIATLIYSQYNYGLDVCGQDAKIEGKLNLDSGNNNVFVGRNSGTNNTTGEENSFFGAESGARNTTGKENSFFGIESGRSNTVGILNSFFGAKTGFQNTSGEGNSFVGYATGFQNTTGVWNTFVGTSSGSANTTGSDNSFLGLSAGNNNITGSSNTFIGRVSGYYNQSGSNIVAIGNGAGPSANNTNLSNRLYINAESNSSVFGNDNPLIYGEFDNDLVRINGTLHISETAKLEPQAQPSMCNTATEVGLLYFDSGTDQVKVCTANSGWQALN